MYLKIIKALDLQKLLRFIVRRFKLGSYFDRISIDAIDRPEYAYGCYQAALQARSLGLDRISVIEFGVASGRGLLQLEYHASEVEKLTGIKIDVYGFDTGEGMPGSDDYRDLPYIWQKSFFKMDFSVLSSRLKSARLVIGDVHKTIPGFISQYNPAPVGFISFDLDYYSSTVAAFGLFDNPVESFLPRVFCFFDDCIGDDWELHNNFTGELLAINEFNQSHHDKKIDFVYGLKHKRVMHAAWNDETFVCHLFAHPLYNKHIYPDKNWQRKI